jgi:dienelactone hydrolase
VKILLVIFFIVAVATKSFPQIHTETVEYKDGDVILKGFLAYNESIKEKRPGVLVVHEWYGLNDYAKMRTEQLAKLGYVAFAADIYGNGIVAKNSEEAGKLAGEYRKDLAKFRRRLNAALEVIEQNKLVDRNNVAAIGYCFGGGGVLELARSGADIKGVVSFHGGLSTPNPDDAKNIKAKVLVLHGADDPYVNAEQIEAFRKEMNAAEVDWQMNYYSYAVHAFTNQNAGNDPSKGAAYNEKADKRSWQAMKDFFDEIFK